jgi:hypothetical protein
MVRRLLKLGWADTQAQCDEALRDLLAEERKVEIAAIAGDESFKTIWQKGAIE